jgi:hypothetical protein
MAAVKAFFERQVTRNKLPTHVSLSLALFLKRPDLRSRFAAWPRLSHEAALGRRRSATPKSRKSSRLPLAGTPSNGSKSRFDFSFNYRVYFLILSLPQTNSLFWPCSACFAVRLACEIGFPA